MVFHSILAIIFHSIQASFIFHTQISFPFHSFPYHTMVVDSILLLLLHSTPTVVVSLKIRKRLMLKKLLPLTAPFQHFHFRFQPLSSKCFRFRFHKKINRFQLLLPHPWFKISLFEQSFYQYITVRAKRTNKDAEEKAHAFSRSKNLKKKDENEIRKKLIDSLLELNLRLTFNLICINNLTSI